MKSTSNNNEPGLVDYFSAFRRRRGLMLAVGLPILLVGMVAAFAVPKSYRSAAQFRLRDTSPEAVRASFSDQYVFDLRDFVLSKPNRLAAVAALNPYPELAGNPDMAADLLRKHTDVAMQTTIILDGTGHNQTINTGFVVGYANSDPQVALKVATWLADNFVEGSRVDASEKANTQQGFLAAEAGRLGKIVSALESRLADFKRLHFSALPESVQSNMMAKSQIDQELIGLDREIMAARQQKIFLDGQLRSNRVNTTSAGVSVLEEEYKRKSSVYDQSHPDMVDLRRRINVAKRGGEVRTDGSLRSELDSKRAVLAEARQRYGEEHPDIKALQRDIESLTRRMAAGEQFDPGAGVIDTPVTIQLQAQVNAINSQLNSLVARQADLRYKSNEYQRFMASSPQVEREYTQINRDLDSAKQKYDEIVKKKMDFEVSDQSIKAGASDKFAVSSAPRLPTVPFKPNRLVIIVLGLAAALFAAAMATIAREAFDSRVRGSKDVNVLLGASPLAVVPQITNTLARARFKRQLATIAVSCVVGLPVAFVAVRMIARWMNYDVN